jgi:catechol 2,3-dioxygenase-like lactoylglutathione lyase family enzyme
MRTMKTVLALLAFGIFLTTAPSAAPAADVVGVGNFTHIVGDLDAFVHFYQDVLGLELAAPARPWASDPAILDLANAPGAEFRFATLKVPGAALGVEGVEYRHVDRSASKARIQDPGAAILVLQVRGLDAFLDRLRQANTRFINRNAVPITVEVAAVKMRAVVVQDPDGFFVELIERQQPGEQAGAPAILGGGFESVVADTDRTLRFYREALGFQIDPAEDSSRNDLLLNALGAAQLRRNTSLVAGTSVAIAFLEFKNVDRTPLHTRFPDPGTAVLQLRVRDAQQARDRLVAAGAEDLSTSHRAVEIRGGLRLALVRDPNNLFLELIQTP